jgi:hypothetical protein
MWIWQSKSVFLSKTKGSSDLFPRLLFGIGQSWSFLRETVAVTSKVALGRLKSNPGTRELVSRFYRAVRENGISRLAGKMHRCIHDDRRFFGSQPGLMYKE